MKFTPEHEALRQTWKTLIDREINPNVDEWEKEGAFPAHELFKKMGDAGLLGVDKPVQFGGSGLDFSYAMVCSESLGLVNGGSIPMAVGVQIVKKLDKLGMRASDTVQTFFDEVKVPVRYTIGQPGMGFVYQMQQFQEERLWAGAGTLMGCDRIINATIDYTRERKVFGRPLLDNQVIHFRLAELKSEVEALRSLVYRACEEYLAGNDVTMLASMGKLKAGRLRREVSDACLQYWGGAGYLWDSPVARSFRDGRLGSIGGGADEVMLQIISKLMGTLPRLGNR